MKFLALFLTFISFSAMACEYLGKDGLLVTKNEILIHDLALKLKDCSENETEIIRNTLSNLEGNISAYQLSHLLNIPDFKLNHERLIIKNLNKLSRMQLALKDNIHITGSNNSPSFVEFNSTDTISIFCNSCLHGQQQKMKLTLRSMLGKIINRDINVDFTTYYKAYRLLTNVPAFSKIDENSIEMIQTEKIPYSELMNEGEHLKYYQTNKPLKAGSILKMSDLSATKIIHAGIKSEIILENHFVKIKTQGIPRSSGAIGEMIEVYHPEKNKKYYGKVIDINKVHVQL